MQEVPGSKYDPKAEELQNIKHLRLRLGKHFDPSVMSIRKPRDLYIHPNGTVKFPYKRNKRGRLVPIGKVSQNHSLGF